MLIFVQALLKPSGLCRVTGAARDAVAPRDWQLSVNSCGPCYFPLHVRSRAVLLNTRPAGLPHLGGKKPSVISTQCCVRLSANDSQTLKPPVV